MPLELTEDLLSSLTQTAHLSLSENEEEEEAQEGERAQAKVADLSEELTTQDLAAAHQALQETDIQVNVDRSTLSGIAKGWEEGGSPSRYVMKLMAANNPENAYLLRWKDEGGAWEQEKVSVAEAYGPEFMDMSYEDRLKHMEAERQKELQGQYGNIDAPGGEMVGYMAKAMYDPVALAVPLGSSMWAAAGIGGAYAGIEEGLRQKVEEGELDGTDIALATTVGAVIGPVLWKGGRVVTDWLQGHAAHGIPVTEAEVSNMMEQIELPMEMRAPIEEIVEAVNKNLNLNKDDAVARIMDAHLSSKRGHPVEYPEQTLQGLEQVKKTYADTLSAQDLADLESVEEFLKATTKGSTPLRYGEAGLEPKLRGRIKEDGKLHIRAKAELGDPVAYQQIDMFHEDIAKARTLRDARKAEEARAAIAKTEDGTLDPEFVKELGADGNVVGRDATETATKTIAQEDMVHHSPVAQFVRVHVGKVTSLINYDPKKLLNTMAHSNFFSRPYKVVQKLGRAGAELAERTRKFDEMNNLMVEEALWNMDRRLIKQGIRTRRLPKQTKLEVTSLLRKTTREADASPEAIEVARETRRAFETALRRAAQGGAITKERSLELIRKGKTEGYFPRIFDDAYLSTTKGRDAWTQALSDYAWTQPQIEGTIKKILHEDFRKFPGIIKQKDGTYKLNKAMAHELWERRDMTRLRGKSHHLERERTLPLPDKVLEPFLVNDPMEVLSLYLQDVAKATNGRAIFGKDDHVMYDLVRQINVSHGTEAAELSKEMVLAMTDSAESKILQGFINKPSVVRNTIRNLKSVESLKLILAQSLNISQANANGLIWLARRQGLPKAMGTVLKGLKRSFTEGGADFAHRSGAAAQTTIMQVAGEMGGRMSNLTTNYLNVIGFIPIERFQRKFAANMGGAYVESLMEKKAKYFVAKKAGKLSPKMAKDLELVNAQMLELGLDPNVAVNVEKMTMDMLAVETRRAAQRFSNAVNFTPTADMLPLATQTPFYSLVRQFKSFAFFQGAFLKDEVLTPLVKGETKAGLNALAALGMAPFAMGGAPFLASEGRQYLWKEDFFDDDFLTTYGRAFGAIGGLGIIYDYALKFGQQGAGGVATNIAGPAVSDMLNTGAAIGKSVYNTGKDRWEPRAEPLLDGLLTWVPMGAKIGREIKGHKGKGGFDSGYESGYKGN